MSDISGADTVVRIVEIVGVAIVGGVLSPLAIGFINRRRNKAEAAKLDADAINVKALADRTSAETTEQIKQTVVSMLPVLENQIKALASQVSTYDEDRLNMKKRISALSEEISVLRDQLSRVDTELAIAKNHLDHTTKDLNDSRQCRDADQRRIDFLETENTKLMQRVAELERERAELRCQIEELQRNARTKTESGGQPAI